MKGINVTENTRHELFVNCLYENRQYDITQHNFKTRKGEVLKKATGV